MDNENDLRLNLLSEQIIENSQFRPRIVTSNGNGSNVALTATGGGGVSSGGSESSVLIPMNSENGSSSTVGLTKPGYQQAIELVWRDLSYKVKAKSDQLFSNPFSHSETSYSTLINNLNGSIRNGQLTAIVGPSGAGKTTLIECLAGRRISGVTGDIVVKFNGLSKKSIKLSYYSQKDSLCDLLTVKESLLYASQLRNCIVSNRSKNMLFTGTDINSNTKQITNLSESLQPTSYHMMVVEKLIEELNLRKCYNTQLKNCSGGQRRRLSIALELIFSPSIFLLDEPTSGLDSLSSLQCIELLKKLATKPDRPMIVATSIHQPTAKIMSYFDHLYILSNTGQCIYNGPPENLLDKMSSIGLHCPQYHNPADFVVEVATGEFGLDCINYLADHFKSVCEKQGQQLIELDQSVKIKKLVQSTQKHSLYNQMMTTVVLTKRCFLQSFRDRKIYNTRFLIMAVTLFLVFILYFDHPIGELDGCVELPTRNTLTKLQNFELADTHNLYFANFGFLFYSVILMVFISILPTLLSFPLEVSVFVKENFNGWYSLQSYYIARTIADLPPMLIFPVIYSSSSFFLTSQVYNHYRFIAFNCILALVSFLAQGLGYLVSAYFVNDVTSSTVVGAVVNVPLFLFTGLLIKISAMPKFFQPITYISYFRLAFEALLVVIYGNGRCPSVKPLNYPYLKGEFGEEILDIYTCVEQFNSNTAENVTIFIQNYNNKFLHSLNQTSNSYALNAFGYNDDIIYFNVFLMFLIAFVLRFATYYILKAKISVR